MTSVSPEKEIPTTNYNPAPLGVLIEVVKKNDRWVTDDHTGNRSRIPLAGLATVERDGREVVVGLHSSFCFRLNEIYLDDAGDPHISRWSSGGVVDTRGTAGIADACNKFNTDREKFNWPVSAISNVTVF